MSLVEMFEVYIKQLKERRRFLTFNHEKIIEFLRKGECDEFINNKEVHRSGVLTDDIDLIPYVGVLESTGTAKTIHLSGIKISRVVFE